MNSLQKDFGCLPFRSPLLMKPKSQLFYFLLIITQMYYLNKVYLFLLALPLSTSFQLTSKNQFSCYRFQFKASFRKLPSIFELKPPLFLFLVAVCCHGTDMSLPQRDGNRLNEIILESPKLRLEVDQEDSGIPGKNDFKEIEVILITAHQLVE